MIGIEAYLPAATEPDLYKSKERYERDKVINGPEAAKAEIFEMLKEYDTGHKDCLTNVQVLGQNPNNRVTVWIEN